ncbi:YceI family protein [Streptomyces sp. NPDC059092]|uniref:YceI family protein n=1 Tax=Streptomyces sp. NPDC059092 TaxID=3346725 RepID=UPI0036A717B9
MTVAVEPGLWQLDQAASVVAVQQKTMWGLVTVNGTFTSVSGQGEVLADGSAQGAITVDAASLDTKHAKRDKHLRHADFFDVDSHPALTFAVQGAGLRSDDTVEVEGRLTVRGVTRPQALVARVVRADGGAVALEVEFTVDRLQFGVGGSQMGMMRGLTTVTATLRFTHAVA